MSEGIPYTQVRRRTLLTDRQPQSGDNVADALMDAVYREGMEKSSRCVVYFGSKHYAKDYIPLEVRYNKEFVSWRDEDGHVRYSFCDAMLSSAQYDFEFGYLQEDDGALTLFVRPLGGEARLGVMTLPQEEELEPVAAWVRGDALYLVMNTPSVDMQETVAPRDRLPFTSGNGGRAFGSFSLWQIPIGRGNIRRTELTTPMDGWCASVIPNADDGHPGIMIINMSPHVVDERRTPRTFVELLADMRAVTAERREVDVPIGVSVYDPDSRRFDRISLDGYVDWGIGSVALMDPSSMPAEVCNAEMDGMGASLIVFDSEAEAAAEEVCLCDAPEPDPVGDGIPVGSENAADEVVDGENG